MSWAMVISIFLLILFSLILMGVPVAFAFLFTNIVTSVIFIGYETGLINLIHSSFQSIASFNLTPIPFFVLMGQVLFHSGLVMRVLDAFSKILGKVPARLSVLTMGTGTLLSAMSGSAVADTATLGSTLGHEMIRRKYHLNLIVGPIVAAGSLALIIPPSTTAILLGSYARISVGDLLIAGIIPGLLIAVITTAYIVAVGYYNPNYAPAYKLEKTTTKEKMKSILLDAVPVSSLIVLVLGSIFTGLVTTSESAAVGAVGAIILALIYRSFGREVIRLSILGTLKVSGMILLIMAAAAGFSQLLAYTGATRGLIEAFVSFDIPPMVTIIFMIIIVLILGTFIDPISIMMITIPLYIPVVIAFDYDLIWFGILMLIAMGIGNITPPFGLLLFTIKGVLPSHITVTNIYRAVVIIVLIQLIVIVILMIFPSLVTFLPYWGRAG